MPKYTPLQEERFQQIIRDIKADRDAAAMQQQLARAEQASRAALDHAYAAKRHPVLNYAT